MRVYLILCTHVQKIPRKKLPFIYRRALSFQSLSARFTHEPLTITYEAHISDFHELCIVDVYIDVSSTQFEYGILLLRSFTNLISKLRFRNYLFSTHGYGTPSVYSFEITSQTKENIKEIPNQIINNGIYF